jgi:hypothetical protein
VTHESFLHVQEYSFDYSYNMMLDFSNDPIYRKMKGFLPQRRHHLMFHNKSHASTIHPFATKGLRVLESENSQISLDIQELNYGKNYGIFGIKIFDFLPSDFML